jgi:hypothetical protein
VSRPRRVVLLTVVCAVVALGASGAVLRHRKWRHHQPDMTSDGLLSFDFVDVFPHKFWVSDWSSDSQYPDGFRYKVLSARREPENVIQFLVVLQQRSGDKEILSSLDINASVFDRAASKFVNGLAKQHGLDFEEQDFSSCRTLEAFDAEAARMGWSMTKPLGLANPPLQSDGRVGRSAPSPASR